MAPGGLVGPYVESLESLLGLELLGGGVDAENVEDGDELDAIHPDAERLRHMDRGGLLIEPSARPPTSAMWPSNDSR